MQDTTTFPVTKEFLDALLEMGITTPSPIQERAFGPIIGGQDVILGSPTGSGKTLAFALPILKMLRFAQGMRPRCIILTPSRELAIQINQVVSAVCKHTTLRSAAVFGGTGAKPQHKIVGEGLDILVATPGRAMELYLDGVLSFKDIKFWVIDEADRMMDQGFMPQLRAFMEVLPKKKQIVLASATINNKVERLAAEFIEWPTQIQVEDNKSIPATIEQVAYKVPNQKTKFNLLRVLLAEGKLANTIIFARSKAVADDLHLYLKNKVAAVEVLHSNKDQNRRTRIFDDFNNGLITTLIATELSCRGIDIPDIEHVINFDLPLQKSDYIHRIGRTGRMGKAGLAITLLHPSDAFYFDRYDRKVLSAVTFLPVLDSLIEPATPFAEQQLYDRAIDALKVKEVEGYKGAFQEKAWVIAAKAKKTKQGTKKQRT